jgi:hypothetical protein
VSLDLVFFLPTADVPSSSAIAEPHQLFFTLLKRLEQKDTLVVGLATEEASSSKVVAVSPRARLSLSFV